jgi:hypothetical protein
LDKSSSKRRTGVSDPLVQWTFLASAIAFRTCPPAAVSACSAIFFLTLAECITIAAGTLFPADLKSLRA